MPTRAITLGLAAVLACACAASACAAPKVAKLVANGKERTLRERPAGTPGSNPDKPAILYLAFDGVNRDLLYDMLRQGRLPNLSALLGGRDASTGEHPHAHLDDHLLSTLPSSTMAAWATTMTGVGPAEHGVTGNEFFVREQRLFACPAPVSFSDSKPTLEIFTDSYMDKLSASPLVYERMREKDPNILIWVGMHDLYRGADELLLTKRGVLASAFEGLIEAEAKKHLEDKESRRLYAELDEAVIDSVASRVGKPGPLPDVLTVYLSGTDLYAHVAEEGPDAARRSYLAEVVDPHLKSLIDALNARGALANRWVVLSADHGHTQVVHDDAHALSTKEDEDPPSLLQRIGFRVRPFTRNVPDTHNFSSVLAYGGAMAYVYLADRSRCPSEKDACDWKQPPRYEEDVLAAAEAFYKNNEDGSIVPPMRGTLDLVLTRRPKPYNEVDAPFEVYVGGGKTVPVDAYLKDHPHPTYVAVDARLRDLAVGVHGERAGDILLLAHNGDRDKPEDRYYFAAPYRSWHGSPSRQDSEIPLVVASPQHTSAAIAAHVKQVLGDRPYQQKVTDVLLGIRAGAFEAKR